MGASKLNPFAIDELVPEPWQNGAGWTRTLCSHVVDGEVLWRVSVADITAASDFSQFPGMDRTAVMVRGGRLQLSNAEGQLHLDRVGSQIRFPGEWALRCSLPDHHKKPTQLLNIMVRRGQVQGRVDTVTGTAHALLADNCPGLVLVLRGAFQWTSANDSRHILQARQGIQWQHLAQDWHADPLECDATMVCCTLRSWRLGGHVLIIN